MIWHSKNGTYKTLNHYQQGGTGSPSGFVKSYYDRIRFWRTNPDINGDIAFLPPFLYLGNNPNFIAPTEQTRYYLKSEVDSSYNNNLVLNNYNIDINENKFYYCMWKYENEPLKIYIPNIEGLTVRNSEGIEIPSDSFALLPSVNRYILFCQVPYNNTDEPYFPFMNESEKETSTITTPVLQKFNYNTIGETYSDLLTALPKATNVLDYLQKLNFKINNYYLKDRRIQLNYNNISGNPPLQVYNNLYGYNEYSKLSSPLDINEIKKDITFKISNMAGGVYFNTLEPYSYTNEITPNEGTNQTSYNNIGLFSNKFKGLSISSNRPPAIYGPIFGSTANLFTPPNASGYIIITQLVRLSKLTRSETKIKIF